MNIYHVRRTDNKHDYDTFSDFVVIAESQRDAIYTHPGYSWYVEDRGEMGVGNWKGEVDDWDSWTNIENVEAVSIGFATETKARIVTASFHAG